MTQTINPKTCNHRWQRLHEEMLFGGTSVAGWRCKVCRQFVGVNQITPAGLGGTITGEEVLHGPCGGHGNCSDGSVYREQVVYPDGRREIMRPDGSVERSQ